MNIELPPKFFNTAGPIQPDIHYNVDSLKRIELDEVLMLIHRGVGDVGFSLKIRTERLRDGEQLS